MSGRLIFRRSKTFGPLRLTASRRGLGGSIGAGRVRLSPRGVNVRLWPGLRYLWKPDNLSAMKGPR